MYIKPSRFAAVNAKMAKRAVEDRIAKQLREDFGINPESDILVITVTMPNGCREHRAHGATRQNVEALKAAGFTWDNKRGFWVSPEYTLPAIPKLEIATGQVKYAVA